LVRAASASDRSVEERRLRGAINVPERHVHVVITHQGDRHSLRSHPLTNPLQGPNNYLPGPSKVGGESTASLHSTVAVCHLLASPQASMGANVPHRTESPVVFAEHLGVYAIIM